MRCRVLALVALVFAPASTPAQSPGTLTVQATSGADAGPVTGALVTIDSGVAGGRTDEKGRWRGTVNAGSRRVRVQAIGYRPRDTVVVVDPAGTSVQLDLPEAIVPLGEVIVTAARREQRLADAVVETELITATELRRGPSDLAAVLSARTGVQLDGGVPAGAGVQLRGFGSRRVLVLVDGQPLVGRINGTLDLSRLPVSSIERIEIVKGPQSTLYGTDAIGGVINVITRQAPAAGTSAGVSTTTGTEGRAEITADAAWRRGALATAIDAGYNGVNLVSGLPSDLATYSRRAHANVRGSLALGDERGLDWGGLTVIERQRYRTGQLFHFGDNVQSALRLGVHHDGATDRIRATASASLFDHLSRAATRDEPASDSGSRDRQRLVQGEVQWSGVRGPRVFDAGVALRREWIGADRLSDETQALTGVEPFAQVTGSLGGVLVTPGARLSWSDRWGTFLAPRIAALFRPRDDIAIRASLGRGYRAPDFKELYLSFVNDAAGYAVYGNPDLRPERSTSVSIGTEWTAGRSFVRASAFNASYRDFIETRSPDATGAYTYGNIDRGWTRGLELEGGVLAGLWRLETGAERLWTRDETTGEPLLGRTPFTLRASATGPILPSLRASIRLAYASRTPVSRDESNGLTSYRDAFPQMDVRLSRSFGDRLELSGEVTNALDRDLGANWPGFTGRRLALQLRWRSDAIH
ncbi:MAG TPA: TonB-dependent receptor [Gemmatimonadaceae bacterium]